MYLSDFSAFIQLSATFCMAYVVIGYAKSFMKTLTDNVFSFKSRFCEGLDDVTNLIDKNSMEQLRNTPSFYKDGNVLLMEELRFDIENMEKEKKEYVDSIDDKVEGQCRVRGFGFLCAYFFLFAFTQLLMIGIFPLSSHLVTKLWLSLTFVSVFLMCIYWLSVFMTIKNDHFCVKILSLMDYNANGMLLFAFALALAAILCFVHISVLSPYLEKIWRVSWVISVLLPPMCFIVCTLTVWIRARSLKKEFSFYKLTMEDKCKHINERITKLKNAQEINDEAARKQEESVNTARGEGNG